MVMKRPAGALKKATAGSNRVPHAKQKKKKAKCAQEEKDQDQEKGN